ncbi:hypothetical protein PR048_032702 [Dryococelus australis]|uniref:Uncharacterized protein n=1 Tax=Dryococelus australis TaxID=614101 RepID=A0ABQ9G2X8_9NEOP|nr:hypothetical protein PR048_032702 [Dryococelus australis]
MRRPSTRSGRLIDTIAALWASGKPPEFTVRGPPRRSWCPTSVTTPHNPAIWKLVIEVLLGNDCIVTRAGMRGRGKREIPEKTRGPTASYGTILTSENPVTRPGIEPVRLDVFVVGSNGKGIVNPVALIYIEARKVLVQFILQHLQMFNQTGINISIFCGMKHFWQLPRFEMVYARNCGMRRSQARDETKRSAVRWLRSVQSCVPVNAVHVSSAAVFAEASSWLVATLPSVNGTRDIIPRFLISKWVACSSHSKEHRSTLEDHHLLTTGHNTRCPIIRRYELHYTNLRLPARERVELSSAKEAMEFTCSKYWDMVLAMGAPAAKLHATVLDLCRRQASHRQQVGYSTLLHCCDLAPDIHPENIEQSRTFWQLRTSDMIESISLLDCMIANADILVFSRTIILVRGTSNTTDSGANYLYWKTCEDRAAPRSSMFPSRIRSRSRLHGLPLLSYLLLLCHPFFPANVRFTVPFRIHAAAYSSLRELAVAPTRLRTAASKFPGRSQSKRVSRQRECVSLSISKTPTRPPARSVYLIFSPWRDPEPALDGWPPCWECRVQPRRPRSAPDPTPRRDTTLLATCVFSVRAAINHQSVADPCAALAAANTTATISATIYTPALYCRYTQHENIARQCHACSGDGALDSHGSIALIAPVILALSSSRTRPTFSDQDQEQHWRQCTLEHTTDLPAETEMMSHVVAMVSRPTEGRQGRKTTRGGAGIIAASTCVRSYDDSAFFTELKRT